MSCSAGKHALAQSPVQIALAAETRDKTSKWQKHEENILELLSLSSVAVMQACIILISSNLRSV